MIAFDELYRRLALPGAVVELFHTFDRERESCLDDDLRALLLCRETWWQGYEELKARIGDDPDGLIELWELMDMVRATHERYIERGIDGAVFDATMGFCARNLNEALRAYGRYRFTAAWWFPRELSMVEFRLGSLEYELIDEDGAREIGVHIPSDADLSPAAVDASFELWRGFMARHFPDWADAPWSCDSWMMAPALAGLLDEQSNILRFQRRFQLEELDENSMGVIGWVFPGHTEVSERLPENTSLQRRLKAHLLSGGKVGWAKGILKQG